MHLALGIFYFTKWKKKFWVKMALAFLLVLPIFSINFLYKGGGDMNILFPETEGYIICFQNSIISQNPEHQCFRQSCE